MAKIVDMTGTKNADQKLSCAKCGRELWNDHGWALDDGSVICRLQDKCFTRQIGNKIAQEKAAGTWNPPWRR